MPNRQPNILVLRGDDIGITNLSCMSHNDWITSNTYYDWLISRAYLMVPAQVFVMQMAQSLVEFPPRQESASFTVRSMLEKLQAGIGSS